MPCRVPALPAASPEEGKRVAAPAASGISMDVHSLELRARNLYSGALSFLDPVLGPLTRCTRSKLTT